MRAQRMGERLRHPRVHKCVVLGSTSSFPRFSLQSLRGAMKTHLSWASGTPNRWNGHRTRSGPQGTADVGPGPHLSPGFASARRRQAHHERRSAAGRVRGARPAAVRRHDPGHDRQTEPGAGPPRSRPPSARQKRSNSASGSLVGQARAVVAHLDLDLPVSVAPGVHLHRRARPACARARCASRLREHLPQLVAGRRARSRDRRPRAAIARPGSMARASADGVGGQRGQVHGLASAGRGTSPSRASVSRSSTSTPIRADSSSIRLIAFSVSAGLAGGADAEQLRVAADRGERRAQLVRRVGEEAPQPPLARLALGERLVEARRASR